MTDLQLKRELIKYDNLKEGKKSEYYVYFVIINDIQVRVKPNDITSKMLLEYAFEKLENGEMGKTDL